MERYKKLQRLGKGAQGSVFLVEDRNNKDEKCVLKKIECSDQIEANKALKEAVALQTLNHPYICGYRSFFLTWDKEEQAMFVCIVMDYYQLGDLDRALKQKRAKGEHLEEMVLKKWLGQMIEALLYVHEKKVIHRDLKPSNIFLNDDLSIAIGDFGVATVMGNVRTLTRTAVGTVNWMAPEVLEASANYDERTDVWSLGCIALEMATCGFMDSAEIAAILFQLKENPQALEEVQATIAEHYSPDLCQFIRTTLRRTFHQRPTTRELTDLPYVQACLALSSSPLYKGPARGSPQSREAKPLPRGCTMDAIAAYMYENAKNEPSQMHALQLLKEKTQTQDPGVSDVAKRRVLTTMKDFSSSVEMQTLCCQVLCNLAVSALEGDVLFTEEFVQSVCLAMKSHAGSVNLQNSASALIMALSSDEGAARVLGQVGGIQDLLAAMRSFPSNLEVVSSCCTALWGLSIVEGNMSIITKERGVKDICSALQTHGDSKDLVDAACSALWSLSMEDGNLGAMADIGVVELLLEALKKHHQDPGVAKYGCAALSSLSEVHDVSAYHVIRTEGGIEGVPIILQTLSAHAGNAEVVESIASLIMELARYDEIREDLNSLKVGSALEKVRYKFGSAGEGDPDAQGAVARALTALAGKNPK